MQVKIPLVLWSSKWSVPLSPSLSDSAQVPCQQYNFNSTLNLSSLNIDSSKNLCLSPQADIQLLWIYGTFVGLASNVAGYVPSAMISLGEDRWVVVHQVKLEPSGGGTCWRKHISGEWSLRSYNFAPFFCVFFLFVCLISVMNASLASLPCHDRLSPLEQQAKK